MDSQNLIAILGRATELADIDPSANFFPPGTAPRCYAPTGGPAHLRAAPVPILSSGPLPAPSSSSCATGPFKPTPPLAKPSPAKAGKSVTKPAAGEAAAKKRTWKKPADKPKRPLSAYNLFFQAERERIVAAKIAEMDDAEASSGDKGATASLSPTAKPQSPRRRQTSSTGRRAHRRTHGKIGFAALAQNIAAKWKVLDDVTKAPFEERAKVEKERYRKEIEVWERKRRVKQQEATAASATKDSGKAEPTEEAAAAKVPTSVAQKKQPSALEPQKKRKLQPTSLPQQPVKVPLAPEAPVAKPQPLSVVLVAKPQQQSPLAMPSSAATAAYEPLSLQSMFATAPMVAPRPAAIPSKVPSLAAAAAAPLAPQPITPPLPQQPQQFQLQPQQPQPLPLGHLDDFEMNIDAIFGAEGASLPEAEPVPAPDSMLYSQGGSFDNVMGSIDRMANDLDGEFVDFMKTFDLAQ